MSILAIVSSIVFVACETSNPRTALTEEQRKQAMDLTLAWGRLAPLPTSAQELTITTEGGMFTRSFRTHFKAPRADLETWIRISPGLVSAESTYADGKRKYVIKPGEGANRAEVIIGDDGSVEIYTSWS